MKSMLEYIAEDLIRRYGNDLSDVAVIFPNKRASLFLNEHLARLADGPLWTPQYITISELFRRNSKLSVADPILLICRLYNVYCKHTGNRNLTLDHFYNWGQLLLSDFDDLDKNMAPADKVFTLVSDIHELDNADFLTDSQREALQHFFSTFTKDHTSYMKKQFLELWNRLEAIYNDYRDTLRSEGIAYEGMLYRDVAENTNLGENLKHKCYCFVGFNMLQKVEQKVFMTLRKEGKALFYWDYDEYYLNNDHEAGHFIKQYLSLFPNALDIDYKNISKPHNITYLSSPTEFMQANHVTQWLLENDRYKCGAKTAIVMCDEKLLLPVISSLPEEVNSVNITTGYPLIQTTIASFVELLIELQNEGFIIGKDRFRMKQVQKLLRHPLTNFLTDKLDVLKQSLVENPDYYPSHDMLSIDEGTTLLFSDLESAVKQFEDNQESLNAATHIVYLVRWLMIVVKRLAVAYEKQDKTIDNAVTCEAIFRMHCILNRLYDLMVSGVLTVDIITLRRLLSQIVSSTSIPFHGEPLEGIQIMGVLETRCLDFDHVLILSCNEGNMPKGEGDTSFIPHSVRKAYEMTTVEHKVGIYSYYFYRLMQRCKDITITYNNGTEGVKSSEMSRFMLQYLVEGNSTITQKALLGGQETVGSKDMTEIEKTQEVEQRVMDYITNHNISPSSLSVYLQCPAKFFFKYIAGLYELDDDNAEELMDNRVFGNVFHKAAETLYKRVANSRGIVTRQALQSVADDANIQQQIIDEAFRTELFKSKDTHSYVPQYNGLQLINRSVILRLFKDMVNHDLQYTPFGISGLEVPIYGKLKIRLHDEKEYDLRIGGFIDRLDTICGEDGVRRMRIVDYKTGMPPKDAKLNDVEAIFSPSDANSHLAGYFLQTLMYAHLVTHSLSSYKLKNGSTHDALNPESLPVSAALMYVLKLRYKDYNPTLKLGDEQISDFKVFENEYLEGLKNLIKEICDPTHAFKMKYNQQTCEKYCPFNMFCKK